MKRNINMRPSGAWLDAMALGDPVNADEFVDIITNRGPEEVCQPMLVFAAAREMPFTISYPRAQVERVNYRNLPWEYLSVSGLYNYWDEEKRILGTRQTIEMYSPTNDPTSPQLTDAPVVWGLSNRLVYIPDSLNPYPRRGTR
jgi:hypothetical protein